MSLPVARPSPSRPALTAVAVTVVLWAGGFAAIRAAVPHYGPHGLTAGRLLVAAAAFAVLAPLTGVGLPPRADLGRLALAALLGMSGYQLLLNTGQVRVTAATASIIIATAPLIAAGLGRALLGERLTTRHVLGASVAFSGVALATAGEGTGVKLEPASLLILAAAAAHAAYFVVMKPLVARYRPLQATAWATWLGALSALPLAAALPGQAAGAPPDAHVAVLALGVGTSAVGFLTWSMALRELDASEAAVYLYLVPPTAALLAWLWLGELPTAAVVLGGAVTLVGVALAQSGRRRTPAEPVGA